MSLKLANELDYMQQMFSLDLTSLDLLYALDQRLVQTGMKSFIGASLGLLRVYPDLKKRLGLYTLQ